MNYKNKLLSNIKTYKCKKTKKNKISQLNLKLINDIDANIKISNLKINKLLTQLIDQLTEINMLLGSISAKIELNEKHKAFKLIENIISNNSNIIDQTIKQRKIK